MPKAQFLASIFYSSKSKFAISGSSDRSMIWFGSKGLPSLMVKVTKIPRSNSSFAKISIFIPFGNRSLVLSVFVAKDSFFSTLIVKCGNVTIVKFFGLANPDHAVPFWIPSKFLLKFRACSMQFFEFHRGNSRFSLCNTFVFKTAKFLYSILIVAS